ncbi:MAG: hypothetical protein JWO46_1103 [Nocardioidaceae bacterium]|nr:hypothetical protein [Nocardioidaceae bacterium]
MSALASTVRRIRSRSIPARVAELEAAVEEQRQLSRRVAELTDLVTDLLVPLADRDQESVDSVVDRYRRSL